MSVVVVWMLIPTEIKQPRAFSLTCRILSHIIQFEYQSSDIGTTHFINK